ncbi:MAG: OsmC family protein [Anaerolineae bacterium]|nr:OsmC family protein [Anaerolineae bacterium]
MVHAHLKWTDGMQFIARAEDGPAVVIDSRDGGSGPSPMQMVLMGIAGCTAVDVVLIMGKKRAKMTGFEIHITGQRAETPPRRYTDVHVEYILRGTGIKPKAVEQAIQLSEEKYCSAMASINANVTHSYRIIDDSEP